MPYLIKGLEDFVWESSELMDRLEDMREDLNHNDFADDVNGAKKVGVITNSARIIVTLMGRSPIFIKGYGAPLIETNLNDPRCKLVNSK